MFADILDKIITWAPIGLMVILLFNLTIFIHELGHFWVGRWRGAKIERFAIWFGPAIWSKVINGVEWRLGCIPLGGYVAFPQLAMEAIEGKSESAPEEIKPLLPKDKIPILFAGSFMNVVLGFIIASIVWVVGEPRDAGFNNLNVGYVSADSPEWKAGIRAGDVIKSINGTPVNNREEIRLNVIFSAQKEVQVGFERDGQVKVVSVVPGVDTMINLRELSVHFKEDVTANEIKPGSPAEQAGIQKGDEFLEIDGEKIFSRSHMIDMIGKRGGKLTHVNLMRNGERVAIDATPGVDPDSQKGLLGVILGSKADANPILIHRTPLTQVKQSLLMMYDSIRALVNRKATGVGLKDFSGPIGIVHHLSVSIKLDYRLALSFLVMLNINLAVVNLLPIPVLDGGHIVFSIIEAIRRKPINQKFLESVQMIFVALLITFILYVSFHDVKRISKFGMFGLGKSKKEAVQTQPQPPKQAEPAKESEVGK